MQEWRAERLEHLPPYLFVDLDRRKREALAAGKDVINLGIGDPDMPTHDFIVDRLAEEIRNPANHRYPTGAGTNEFIDACMGFFQRRFDVSLKRDNVTALIGSKEGIGHLPTAVLNPGETVLIPAPGYPVYTAATIFAGGVGHEMPLIAANNWLPDLDAIPPDVAENAKLMYLNYPNNPTGAVADIDFFKRLLGFARKHHILIAHDAAYSQVFFEFKPPSILQVPGAIDNAIEFHSLSKSFNMTGWRIGFAVGNPGAVAALTQVKDNLDSGQFNAIQNAASDALDHADHVSVRAMSDLYRERRDIVVSALNAMGISAEKPQAGFYVWAGCPDGYTSAEFAAKLLDRAAVVVVPGTGFGRPGEGYFRIALTVGTARITEALRRMESVNW
ncbi:MAG: LL-diaminopimelate aminotransferase [Phycisphaerae bacterium]